MKKEEVEFSVKLQNTQLLQKMVATGTWLRYMASKLEYSLDVAQAAYVRGHIADRGLYFETIWKNFVHGRLTFLHWNKGQEIQPECGAEGVTLLVRKIPAPSHMKVRVGDVVVLKDPEDSANYIVRRLAATQGYEMASTDPDDIPFVLEKDQCWVLADNKEMKLKEVYDSRTFGPVTMADIVGRAIYCLRSAVDHGPVANSLFSRRLDSSVVEVELDIDEMVKNHKA